MATTSLWRVRGYIGKVLLYAEDPEKTTLPKSIGFDDADKDTLEDVIAYASREEATNQRQLISGINCCPKTARTEMLHTKEAFDKESGTIAYHGYQSFQEGEVTPELAHTIGVRLATELWGDKYEVIVATHVDKASHIHNHFVINTVSFVDGRKFHRTKKDYLQMREKSDALCKEYGLSVIENPLGKGKHYAEWFAERNGETTWRSIIRDDVDVAVKSSITFQQFVRSLRDKGYEVERRGTILRLRPPGKERFVRFATLGENYTEEAIVNRILRQQRREHPPQPRQPAVRKAKVYGDFRLSKITWKGLRALYFFYLRKLRQAANQPKGYAPYVLRDDLRKLDEISNQTKFLFKHKLDTAEQIIDYRASLEQGIDTLCAERTHLRNVKRHASVTSEEIASIDLRIAEISKLLGTVRKDIRMCNAVLQRSLIVQENYESLKKTQVKEVREDEPARRSSGTDRKHGDQRDRERC